MKFGKLVLLATSATAHTIFSNFFVDGANQGDAVCVRMSDNPSRATFPIDGISSPDMACGVHGETGVARICPANASSVLTFEFRVWPDASQPGALDISHKGPCAVYMKKVDDASASNNAHGDGWFKIWEESYDESVGKWCTEKNVMDSNGLLSVQLPSDLESGHYLVRPELLALHSAGQNPPDPQFYVGCAQIFLTSSGSSAPSSTVSIPGHVNMESNRKAMTFNIWAPNLALPYPSFGPPVYGNANAKRGLSSRDTSQQTQTTGFRPEGCVLEVGNWCGMEIQPYSDEAGCWDASESCWKQTDECYKSSGPTGGQRCKIWEKKCNGIQDTCSNGSFRGPPSAGRDLTPPSEQVQVPAPVNAEEVDNTNVAVSPSVKATSPTTMVTVTVTVLASPTP